jgi:hypothetical protein
MPTLMWLIIIPTAGVVIGSIMGWRKYRESNKHALAK